MSCLNRKDLWIAEGSRGKKCAWGERQKILLRPSRGYKIIEFIKPMSIEIVIKTFKKLKIYERSFHTIELFSMTESVCSYISRRINRKLFFIGHRIVRSSNFSSNKSMTYGFLICLVICYILQFVNYCIIDPKLTICQSSFY